MRLGGAGAFRAIGRGVADGVIRNGIQPDRPGGDFAGMADSNIALRHLQQFSNKIPDIAPRYPGCAQPGVDVARKDVGRLHGFQCFHIGTVFGVDGRRRFGCLQLHPHVAA